MINLIVIVGFAVLAGWVGQQAVHLSPALLVGVIGLCMGCTYLGSRLSVGKGRG